jgi:hypothetical protein
MFPYLPKNLFVFFVYSFIFFIFTPASVFRQENKSWVIIVKKKKWAIGSGSVVAGEGLGQGDRGFGDKAEHMAFHRNGVFPTPW